MEALGDVARHTARAWEMSVGTHFSSMNSGQPQELFRSDSLEEMRAAFRDYYVQKAQIENQIKNSTGSVREQWKYRMAVLQEKMKTARQEEVALK